MKLIIKEVYSNFRVDKNSKAIFVGMLQGVLEGQQLDTLDYFVVTDPEAGEFEKAVSKYAAIVGTEANVTRDGSYRAEGKTLSGLGNDGRLHQTIIITSAICRQAIMEVAFMLRTRAGAKFQSSNILRIIRHEGYTGYIITKNARSEYIPELQIIDQETFEKANDIISRRSAKTAQDRRIAHTSQNPTLLAGIVYCAHCGAKMSGFMHTDRYKLADGSIREKVQPKYNCFQRGQRNKGGRDCDGQALYLAERVDAIVLKIVEEVFEQIRDTPYSQVAENRIRQESNLQKTKRAAAEKKIKAAQHALERFEGEILKCLDGTSNFTEDMIAKQIRRYQQELDDAKAEYAELQNARLNEAAEIRKLRTYYDDFKGWAEEFDTAPLEMKRMILSHLIDRVEVGRKYQVIVKFNMKYRQFLECTAETYNTEIGA